MLSTEPIRNAIFELSIHRKLTEEKDAKSDMAC